MNARTLWQTLALLTLLACGGAPDAQQKSADLQEDDPATTQTYDLNIPEVEYAWDPAAGDPSVSAEMGGPGFTGEGWQTNMRFPAIGAAEALKGGTVKLPLTDWPSTLRQTGKDSNNRLASAARELMVETLLDIHPTTLEYIPSLATHWQISDDNSTYRYRINPAARFSNGDEVTSQTVINNFKMRMNPDILDPSGILVFGKMEEPKAISKYIVEVRAKKQNWRNFLYFSVSLYIYPDEITTIPGDEYLDKYQNRFPATTAAYEIRADDIKMGQSITLTKRADWWAKDNPSRQGVYNIEKIQFDVVKEPGLIFEKLKKGELDYWVIPRAQWWAEELPKVPAFKNGALVGRKYYTDNPGGIQGGAINMTRPILKDLAVRKALQHLFNRKLLIDKLFFNEYLPLHSYYPGSPYTNTSIEPVTFDEVTAVELLEGAGWTTINSEGYREKDGRELLIHASYPQASMERYLTIFQESCKRAGIRLELQQLTPASAWKNLQAKEYDISFTAWTGLLFPNPETSYHSSLATQKHNNNVTGFADPELDILLEKYDAEYDIKKRQELIQEIDGIIYRQHPYVLSWYNPAERVVFWNKFSTPKWGTERTGRASKLLHIWWIDPEKEKLAEAAKTDPSVKMDPGPKEVRFWEAWKKANSATQAAPTPTNDNNKTPPSP